VIPFEVCFDLELKLWSATEVLSDHLRLASAVIDSSVLEVDTDVHPLADAQLELVTVIPLPLWLTAAEIFVDTTGLDYDLNIVELVEKRNCDFQAAFCTQHWRVNINPQQCTLNGQFVARVTGACHPDADNCIEPTPNTSDIVMDIRSDDFCGVTQEVEVQGYLDIEETQCNKKMKGSIRVENSEGAAINQTRIMKVRAEPTLEGSNFMTIYDESYDVSVLDFTWHSPQSNVVDFEFKWHGAHLRCDVNAHLEVMVMVEFDATRPLLLSVGPSGARMLEDGDMKEETMRMLEATGFIASDPSEPTDSTSPPSAGNGNGNGSSPAAASSPSTLSVLVASLVAALLVLA
jgi:hypothetical protein